MALLHNTKTGSIFGFMLPGESHCVIFSFTHNTTTVKGSNTSLNIGK